MYKVQGIQKTQETQNIPKQNKTNPEHPETIENPKQSCTSGSLDNSRKNTRQFKEYRKHKNK